MQQECFREAAWLHEHKRSQNSMLARIKSCNDIFSSRWAEFCACGACMHMRVSCPRDLHLIFVKKNRGHPACARIQLELTWLKSFKEHCIALSKHAIFIGVCCMHRKCSSRDQKMYSDHTERTRSSRTLAQSNACLLLHNSIFTHSAKIECLTLFAPSDVSWVSHYQQSFSLTLALTNASLPSHHQIFLHPHTTGSERWMFEMPEKSL